MIKERNRKRHDPFAEEDKLDLNRQKFIFLWTMMLMVILLIALYLQMDMIFIVSNTPNPLDPAKEFPSVPVSIEVYDAPEVDLTDECVNYRPENYRAFENTWEYYNLLGR